MAAFRFRALDSYGEPVAGTLDAPDTDGARAQLARRGWAEVELAIVASAAPALRSAPPPSEPEPWGPPTSRDLPDLLAQLQSLIRAGVPLPAGLRASASELDSASLRRTCLRLADRIEGGDGLEAALVAESGRFPGQVRGLISAGVQTGTLALVLAQVVRSANLGRELRRRALGTVAYPALIAGALGFLVLFVCRVTTAVNFGADGVIRMWGSPSGTAQTANFAQALFVLTSWVADHDAALVVGLAAVGLGAAMAWRFGFNRVQRGRFVRALPLVGPMVRSAHLAEFCHLAAILVDAALPLPEALALAGASVADPALSATTDAVADQVATGQPLAEALQTWTDLPPALGQILAGRASHADLAGALRFAGEMFEARAAVQSKVAAQILAGLLLILIFWLGCFAVAAIYLPIQVTLRIISGMVWIIP